MSYWEMMEAADKREAADNEGFEELESEARAADVETDPCTCYSEPQSNCVDCGRCYIHCTQYGNY